MERKEEVLTSLQALANAAELYLEKLDPIAKAATRQFLNHAINVLFTELSKHDAIPLSNDSNSVKDDKNNLITETVEREV